MTDALGFVCFKAELELKTDLHIGDGSEAPLKRTRGPRGEGEPESTHLTIVRNAAKVPVIPGTALKGVLRASVAARHGEAEAGRLFGAIKAADESSDSSRSSGSAGHIGRITFYASRQCQQAKAPDLPESCQPSTAIATHVAIGRKYGVAEAQKLFNREIVPAGARFRLEGIVRGVNDVDRDLKIALAPLVAGIELGRGISKGNGRIELPNGGVDIKMTSLDVSGGEPKIRESDWCELRVPSVGVATPVKRADFSLHCPGPFLSHDPDRRVQGQDNVLFALRRDDSSPVLWPESLYGVLRERCAWLAASDNGSDGDRDSEERFTPLPADKDAKILGRTGRLFGVPGWRGLVRIESLRLANGRRLRSCDTDSSGGMAGISIDRFSGAVLDTGPFLADAWVGLSLTFTLILDRRGCCPYQKDIDLFRNLVDHIRCDGLLLGHGVNRGYGWFDPVSIGGNSS